MNKFKYKTGCMIVFLFALAVQSIQGQQAANADSTVMIEKSQVISNKTAAISTVSGSTLYKTATANLTNTLYGLLPGLSVIQGLGEPGYDMSTINIRGIGAYTYGGYAVYVDGFQSDMDYAQHLTPLEIESFSVLKDAASLAQFGMKGANGILWIETKRGYIGKPTLNVNFRTGIQQLSTVTKPLQSFDYATLYNEAISNDMNRQWSPFYTQQQLDDYKSGAGINSMWLDETLKQATPFTSADVSFSGGGKDARYFILVNYTGSNGLYNTPNDDRHSSIQVKQYNIRSNFDFTIFDYIDGKIDLGGRIDSRTYPNFSGSDLWKNLERYPNNIYPINNPNGSWTGTTTYPDNPVASIRELGIRSTHDRSMQVNFSLKERLDFLLDGLFLSQAISFSNWTRGSRGVTKDYSRYIGTVIQTPNVGTNYEVTDDYGTNQWNWQQFKIGAGYNKLFGEHAINVNVDYLQSMRRVDANLNGPAGINTNYGYVNTSGVFNYGFAEKYYGQLSFSYSGSDNYRPGNRYTLYPAVSAAWVLSKEDFLSDVKAVDYLKLRLSVGQAGYDWFDGPRYLYEQYYQYNGSHPTGNAEPNWQRALTQVYLANSDIHAEKSTKYNIGLDATLFKGLTISADAFVDKRSEIVSEDHTISGIVGVDAPLRNIGKVTTQGVEFMLAYKNSISNFSYNLGVIGTYIKDKIDDMAELPTPSPFAMQTGDPIGTQIGYKAIGFYDVSDFDAQGNLINLPTPAMGNVQPGDLKYANLNGDNVIDERDRTVIGHSSFPDFTYAFTAELGYSHFDLRILLQGVTGREVNVLSGAYNKVVAFENNGNAYPWAKQRWAYYPDQGIDTRSTATYPRLSTVYNSNNYTNSSFWIKNGNFLKLRNVEIGYSLSENILSKLSLKSGRVFINGVNLLTFSSLLKNYNIDPETMSGYPGIKSYNLGITLGF